MATTEPAWLTAMVDQRLALLEHAFAGGTIPEVTIVMTPLTEPKEGATPTELSWWERSCDNCATYCKPGQDFYTGHVLRKLRNGTPVTLTFGVCKSCRW